MKNVDGTKHLHAYVQAVRKQGGKLLMPTTRRTADDTRRQRAAANAELKKTSN